MTKKTQGAGEKPAPRGDTTRTQRTQKHRAILKEKVMAKGWLSASEILTAFENGELEIPEFVGTKRRPRTADNG